MFNYSVKVRKINSAKLKGVATLVIEDMIEIDGFKIIDGSKGLFVSVPSHKGRVVEEGVEVEKYFDDVRFPSEDARAFGDELKKTILDEYNSQSNSPQNRAQSAAARNNTNSSAPKKTNSSGPPRSRKPLWGF